MSVEEEGVQVGCVVETVGVFLQKLVVIPQLQVTLRQVVQTLLFHKRNTRHLAQLLGEHIEEGVEQEKTLEQQVVLTLILGPL